MGPRPKRRDIHLREWILGIVLLGVVAEPASAASRCFGTVSSSSIEGSVQLPAQGTNFSAYSRLAVAAGRTHVHSAVAEVITSAYAALRTKAPSTVYVYGETGWPSMPGRPKQ